MSIDLSAEKAKWDSVYSSLLPASDTPHQSSFNTELVKHILALLPEGGRSIEAGCGAGGHSLSLARTGFFQTTLLDISEQALRQAKQRFDSANIDAEFIIGSALEHGVPEFDLVFNNGTLEHYSFDEQVAFVKAMSSRSRRYVISIVPNAACYWYWIWRTLASAKGDWPYGIEVPVHGQADVFQTAKLNNVRIAYLGWEWTEDMIATIDGLSADLRDAILAIHRSPLIPLSQKCYLVATVGEISEKEPSPSDLWAMPGTHQYDPAKAMSVLADALSAQITAQLEVSRLSTESSVLEAARSNAEENIRKTERSLQHISSQLRGVSDSMVEVTGKLEEALSNLKLERQKNNDLELALNAAQVKLSEAALRPHSDLVLLKPAYWLLRKIPRNSFVYKLLLNIRRVLRKLRADGVTGLVRIVATRALRKLQMNPYEYVFDLYLRDFQKSLPIKWEAINVPNVPGLVTIVLPCYNGSELLKDALDSLIEQTYKNIEIIAINDGSTDDTAVILEDYAKRDSRFTVIHQENRKLPRTLSRGFRLANGEFLTWTSVDNRMKADCIAEMVASLQRHPDWDMIYANIDIIGETGEPLVNTSWYGGYQTPRGSEHIHLPTSTTELNTWPNNYIGAAFLYRSRVAWTVQDYSPIRFLTEDYDYWMRVNELMKLRHADFSKCIYDYRFHDNSLTSKDKELGITQNRVKLMVFDDFRRSFLLSKCVWSISTDDSLKAKEIANCFKFELVKRKAIILDANVLATYALSKLWMPIAAVHFSSEAQPCSLPNTIQDTACLVLVNTGQSLPQTFKEGWDLCVTTNSLHGAQLPRIEQTYKGWFSITNVSDLVSFCDIQTKNKQLGALELALDGVANQNLGSSVAVSAVVCTYKRSTVLEKSIKALINQSLPPREYEIIIVNNEPSDPHPRQIVADILEKGLAPPELQISIVDCPIPGLSHARNVGLSESNGKYVVFIDDDAIADQDCLKWMNTAFIQNPAVGVIGGHIRLNLPEPRPEVCPLGREALWSQYLTDKQEFSEITNWWEFPYGALWGARRAVLFEMGGFRCNLGRIGNDFGGGEEMVAAALAQKLGYAVGVEPRSEVLHDVELHRYSIEHVQKTIRAAEMVNYRMQINLHRPVDTGLTAAVKAFASLRGPKEALRLIFKPRKPTIHNVYSAAHVSARYSVLKETILDFLKKFRRPKASGEA